MECTKLNCPMQAGTVTENCGDICPWRTTAKVDDLILRVAAIDALKRAAYWQDGERKIAELPAVDAVPVVHGRWITNKYGETVCSECDNNAMQVLTGCLVNMHFEPHKSKFCPNCGARMDGERRRDNGTD